jgi:hypothetical protein
MSWRGKAPIILQDEHLLKPVALDVVQRLFRHPKLAQRQIA